MPSARSRIAGFLAFTLAVIVPLAVGVQQEELQKFFASTNGLDMTTSDASNLASKEQGTLTKCGITVPYLQELRDVMYKTTDLDFSKAQLRDNILPAAYQHAGATDLGALYHALYSTSSADLPKADAQKQALMLAAYHAEPYLVTPLYQALYSTSKIDLPKSEAQTLVVNLTFAGADADVLASTYAKNKGYGKQQALQWATLAAVEANLDGLDERYAKNAQPYTAKEFYSYYGDSWLGEWSAAPKQKRTASDGIDYFASEFKAFFGGSWSAKWTAAPVATLHRIAEDGNMYTIEEFKQYYGDAWQGKWSAGHEVLDLCAGLNQATCKGSAKCQWKWNGDWTTSCVPQPLGDAEDASLVV